MELDDVVDAAVAVARRHPDWPLDIIGAAAAALDELGPREDVEGTIERVAAFLARGDLG
ncbi:hypothetical protein OJ997_27655 [Solirubrobacter phytolaccae]|uniref:Uncharacterized protein n=1 Tax=Solirubrobacter phytolaccae TaxID=1404360 RepID=A0A9X3SBZ9_9ACTN|nr:hypothetical protein [Solirubrobacter phytolaccae]MDA0184116.1 hypothetical protein [Solirubrobacter phytolaccae]